MICEHRSVLTVYSGPNPPPPQKKGKKAKKLEEKNELIWQIS